jgi:thiamine biosynthesis protein ThiI
VAKLVENLKAATRDLAVRPAQARMSRIEVPLLTEADWPEVRRRIEGVFGVVNFSLAERGFRNAEELKRQIGEALEGKVFRSFRIHTKRADKAYPWTSPQLNTEIGAYVKERTRAAVDLDHPELTVQIEILPKEIFFSIEKVPGPGGLPVGISGPVLGLISGGIDSPLAVYRMMQRGCRVVFVHFHSVPYLNRTSQEKVKELVTLLTRHQFHSRLFLVPFGEIQREIVLAVKRPYRIVLYRRMMLRIAETIARQEGAKALITGESLGQVASQTLDNIATIEEAATLPVLRPLIGMDKNEISHQAERIGTFSISIIPDQDCCQLFTPRHPSTSVSLEQVKRIESGLNVDELVKLGVGGAELVKFTFPG